MILDGSVALRVHLCADEVIVVAIDPRTGRLTLRDTGDLAAAGRGPRCAMVSERVNENPLMIYEALIRLRYNVSLALHIRHFTNSIPLNRLLLSWQSRRPAISGCKASALGISPSKVSFLCLQATSITNHLRS